MVSRDAEVLRSGARPRGRAPLRKTSASRLTGYSFTRLPDHVVHDRLQVAGLFENAHLPVGAVALFQNAEGVFDLLARAQLVEHVAQEPLDQLADEVAGRQLLLLAEVHEPA